MHSHAGETTDPSLSCPVLCQQRRRAPGCPRANPGSAGPDHPLVHRILTIVKPPRIPARPIALTGWSLMRLCPAVSLSRKQRKWHRASRALRSTSMTWARSEGHGTRRTDYEQPTHIQREEEFELPGLGELEAQPEHRCQAVVQTVASPPAPETQEQQLLTSGHPWD